MRTGIGDSIVEVEELTQLETWITSFDFRAFGAIGGRGLGKIALLDHSGKQLHARSHLFIWNSSNLSKGIRKSVKQRGISYSLETLKAIG